MNLLVRFWHWLLDPLPTREFPMPFERRIETDPTEPPPPVLRRQPTRDVGGMGPPEEDD